MVCIQWHTSKHKTGSNRFPSYISAYKLQKHSFALYVRHFTQLLNGSCVLSLRKKTFLLFHLFVSCLLISYPQHGQSEDDCPCYGEKTVCTAGYSETSKSCRGGEEKTCCKKTTQNKEGQSI